METKFKQSMISAGNEAAVRHPAKQSFTRLYFAIVSVWHPANQSLYDFHLLFGERMFRRITSANQTMTWIRIILFLLLW
jgi:hypothetical protein